MEENKKDFVDVDMATEKMFVNSTDIDVAIERQLKKRDEKLANWQANCEAELRSMKKKLDSILIHDDETLNYITGNIISSTLNHAENGGEI